MGDHTLRNCRVLVVEDEYLIAVELQTSLEDEGAVVLGPVATLADASELVETEPRIDGAILDANLGGEMVFPVADLLMLRRVPIVFTTGYDASIIPDRFRDVARCEKPINMKRVVEAIGLALHE